MPVKLSNKVLSWATDLDDNTVEQAEVSSRAQFIPGHIALMPDAHLGYGVTIGSVIPTEGAIMPSAVGVDIGCGMSALQLDLTSNDLPDNLSSLLSRIGRAIPAATLDDSETGTLDAKWKLLGLRQYNANWIKAGWDKLARRQLGTLGGGNHFVELCLDGDDGVWLVLHSGSRGIGNQLARMHIEEAKGLMEKYFIELDDPDLAYFVEGTKEFDAYWSDLQWAQKYAANNRSAMLRAALGVLRDELGRNVPVKSGVNCHHNYTAKEVHGSRELYITRKGAISAKAGQLGIIPGSMGTNSYIVKGLGNKSAYNSAPHGAGRRMSRRKARETFTADDLTEAMGDRQWLGNSAKKLVDEHPGAYKDIHEVIRNSSELVEVVTELTQILNYKGTR